MFSTQCTRSVVAVLAGVSSVSTLSCFGVSSLVSGHWILRSYRRKISRQLPRNGQQAEAPPAAGGPTDDVGPYAMPKKKEEPPPPPPPEKPKKVEGMPDYSIHVDVPLVEVPVLVTTKDGQFIPNLKQENFRVYEDGVPQTIANFASRKRPITAVLLVEFASDRSTLSITMLCALLTPLPATLKKEDWVAVVSYDMKPHILVDFTQDKQEVMGGSESTAHPGFFRDQSV